ncbi:hypothetical protein AQS8620_01110 [Aquimixticola soesokkakensis]|uniref:Recombinase XerC n=1 Tax=Aquimixticola soesokkakensis TaxID=1519096 RepID=A0A1Y5S587_9RHOB|nr:DUF484 family protein [Aquimixticola soesokkakensis]SLN32871.1 hypothetical protein AQS8620_01110 [Aquimixticola soesokkakensis]
MTHPSATAEDLREQIISDPDTILDDPEVMRALVAANERVMGTNIVDLRGIAMERLEHRLDRLEDTHRGVIAAAYENLAGTNQIHRAILALMEPLDFESFLSTLTTDVAGTLRVDAIRLVLETRQTEGTATPSRLGNALITTETGFIDSYLTLGRNVPLRQVTLRQVTPDTDAIYGDLAGDIHSEACLRLNLGPGRLPGMLVMGAEDPHQFKPTQGTDLLAFFGGVFERTMRRWLS